MAGISYINYADYCDITNLRVISGPGSVAILAGSLASLKTRQLADAIRIKYNSPSTFNGCIISFDVVAPLPPSAFGGTGSAVGLSTVGAFALLGFVPVSTYGDATFPMIVARSTVRGYVLTPSPGNVVNSGDYVSAIVPFNNFSSQDGMTITNSAHTNILLPYAVVDDGPQYSFTELLSSDNPASPTLPWSGSPWSPVGAQPLMSLRIDIIIAATARPPGDYIFDIGRLWLGPSLVFSNGATMSTAVRDPSTVVASRDGQAYSTRFARLRQNTFSFPALTELEALGYGPSPRPGAVGNGLTWNANSLIQAQYSAGNSAQVLAWAGRRPPKTPVGGVAWVEYSRNAIFGAVTQWQPVVPLLARRATVAGKAGTGRLYSGGLTVQEER